MRNFRDERYAQILSQRSFGNQASSFELGLAKPEGSFKEKIALTRAAESLRERMARSKEYEIISETEEQKNN